MQYQGEDIPSDDLFRSIARALFEPSLDRTENILKITLKGRATIWVLKLAFGQLARPIEIASKAAKPIAVEVDRSSNRLSYLLVTNKSGRVLHNCLMLSHLLPDLDRLTVAGVNMVTFHKTIDELVKSVDDKHEKPDREAPAGLDVLLEGAFKADMLRFWIAAVEQGNMVFVPEIPPGARVKIGLAPPVDLEHAQEVTLSLWCEELSIPVEPASNFRGRSRQGLASGKAKVSGQKTSDERPGKPADKDSFELLSGGSTRITLIPPPDGSGEYSFAALSEAGAYQRCRQGIRRRRNQKNLPDNRRVEAKLRTYIHTYVCMHRRMYVHRWQACEEAYEH